MTIMPGMLSKNGLCCFLDINNLTGHQLRQGHGVIMMK